MIEMEMESEREFDGFRIFPNHDCASLFFNFNESSRVRPESQ